jgi:hypothetical protein
MLCRMSWLALSFLAPGIFANAKLEKRSDTASYASSLLQESMNWMDMYYDAKRGYLFSFDATTLTHNTRSSVWYAAGLLARNAGDDAEQAARIIRNVVGAQFRNETLQW